LVFSSIFHFFGCSFLFSPLLCSHFSVQVYSLVGSRRVRGSPSDAIIVLFRVLHFFHIVYVFSLIYTLSIFSLKRKKSTKKQQLFFIIFFFSCLFIISRRADNASDSKASREKRDVLCRALLIHLRFVNWQFPYSILFLRFFLWA
jgi:hypothetical protein